MKLTTNEDGDFTRPSQEGPWIPTQDVEVMTTKYSATFIQNSALYAPLALGSKGPNGATLISEDNFSCPGGNYIRWKRNYALTPPTRVVPELFVYSYQQAVSQNGQLQIVEFPIPVNSSVTYDYFLTPDPSKIPVYRTLRMQQALGNVYEIGDPPDPNANFLIGENSAVRRWGGLIWERTTRRVPLQSATAQPQ